MSITEAQFQAWLAALFWPFLRVGGVVMAAPLFNSRQVPVRWRLLLALILTLVIVPGIPPVPRVDPLSLEAVLLAAQQVLIGVAMGVALQLAFAALVLGGQVVATKMGLGFAQMVDPQNGVQVPVLSQYYLILSTLVFLFLNGHLLLIDLLSRSFHTLPVGNGLQQENFHAIVVWGSDMFSGGLLVALPAVAALLLVNLAFGVVTRAAPQLHIFAIGFPLAMLLGFGMIWLSLPGAMDGFTHILESAFTLLRTLVRIGG
jgi:flagellar biosynthetic protein FliR